MSSTQEAGDLFGKGPGPAHAMLRSPTVLIASVGLWGMNVFFFRVFGIDYVRVLKHDLLKIDGAVEDAPTLYKKVMDQSPADITTFNNGHSSGTSDDSEYEDEDAILEGSSEHASAITWFRLVALSLLLLIMLHSVYFVWIGVLGGGPVGAVIAFYSVVSIAIFLPLPSLHWLRRGTVIVLQRSFELFNPRCSCLTTPEPKGGPRPIPFVDVFFADAMCSLSKVFFDWGILLHMAANPGPVLPKTQTIVFPSALAAVPYIIRARQCLLMYTVGRLKSDPKRYSHLWNALKYSTSIFPLCLSAYSKTQSAAREKELEFYLVILLIINALFALYWDVTMDWGMMQNPITASSAVCFGSNSMQDQPRAPSCCHAFLRHRLRFGVAMSALILFADAVLRFGWVLRFYKKLFPNEDAFVLCTQFLEVFRRAIWNLLRVEWENLKQLKSKPNVRQKEEEMSSFLSHTPVTKKIAIA